MLKTIEKAELVPQEERLAEHHRLSRIQCCVVIPCYNEEQRLSPEIFLEFLKAHPHIEFIFVNDGSRDGTLALLRKMRVENPYQIRVLDQERNQGKAEAVRAGLILAARGQSAWIGYWDADLATPLEAIEEFLGVVDRLRELDIIYGTRAKALGHRVNRTLPRRFVSKVNNILARMAVRFPATDTQCGAKLFRNTSFLRMAISRPFRTKWIFDVELLARIVRNMPTTKDKIYEHYLIEWEEVAGSNIKLKDVLQSGFIMLYLIFQTRILRKFD